MKRIVALLLAFSFGIALIALPAPDTLAATDYSMIKVKLTTNNATVISMSVKGGYFIQENGAEFKNGTLTLRSNLDGTLTATHSAQGELYTGASLSIMREEMSPSAGYMYFNSRSYLGHFNVRVLSSGYLQVVNVVPLAHYLYGVVGHEMSNTFPIEALKAQAIAAKCYVLSLMKTGSAEYYIGDTSSDQVYKGYTASNTNVIRAVNETLSEILTVNGAMLCTYYAASNGGETNLVTYAWSSGKGTNAGYAISLDEYDLKNTMSPIEKIEIPINTAGSINRAFYNMLLAKAATVIGTTPTGVERISEVEAYSPRYSGVTRNMTRVKVILSVIANGYLYEDVELDFNVADLMTYGVFTNATLRTYWGEYDASSGCYILYHARWGHGVGMSQRGAQQRANEGWGYRDILSFYYPGASFSTISVTAPSNPVKPGETPAAPDGLSLIGYGVLTGNVNFRKGPGQSYESYGTLAKGIQIPIYEKSGSWYRTVLDERDGYVSASYVDFTPVDTTNTPTPTPMASSSPSSTLGTGYISAQDVNFRTGPSTSYSSIKKLARGTELTAYALQNGWYYVNIAGIYGYVSAQYVKLEEVEINPSPSPSPSPTPVQPTILGTGYISAQDVNFRTGPSTSYSSMKKLARGTELTAYSLQNGWYYVNIEGMYGYVSAQYVKIEETGNTATPTPDTTYSAEIGTVTRSGVNFRADASSASALLRQLEKNMSIYVLGKTGDWYYAVADGQFGYVYEDYVGLTGEKVTLGSNGKPISTEEEKPKTGKGVTTGNVNFRKGPGTNYATMGTLVKGVELTLVSLEDGWYQVSLDDQIGYVSSKYINVTVAIPDAEDTEDSDTPELTVPDILGLGQTTTNVNFREEASSSSKKLGQIKSGETVMLYSLADGWYAVEYNGTRGYLYAKYVKMIAQSSGSTGGVVPEGGGSDSSGSGGNTESNAGVQLAIGAASGELNFRDKPSTSTGKVLATLKKGEQFQILGETDEWYYVIYNGQTGFVYKAYARVESSGSVGIARVSDSVAPISTTTTAEVNLRHGMSTNSEIVRLLPNKTSVTVYMIFDGWCFLSQNGTFGFCVTDYVKL